MIEATSSPLSEFPSRTRSAVTNHKDVLPGLDGRSASARRFRDLVNAFLADMGGLDRCSEIKLGLVRRLAATTVQAEMLEARMVNGEAIDIGTLCMLASTRRLWDELVPPPTRQIACRLTTTYAGYEGESLLLQDLYRRGLQQPQIGDDLHAGDGNLMFWSHRPVAPWQDERWLVEMRRTLRPNAYQRLVLNEFASAESQFVDMSAWDQCVQPSLTPTLERIPIYVGVDASVKRDSTALVAVTFDKKAQVVRLVQHRVFTPAPGDPINFEATVEATIIDWRRRFVLRQVLFDPFQMAAVSQRLAKAQVPIEEYPQSVPNLTAATSNLFDLIQSRSIALYSDAAMRLAVSRAIIVESSRGWRLDKLKQQHKIDVVVALSMACLAAVRGQGKPGYDLFAPGLFDD